MTTFDSVFLAASPFQDDRPWMSEREIQAGLDRIDGDATDTESELLEQAIEAIANSAFPLVERSDLKSVQALEFPQLQFELQRPILETWVKGFELGQGHGQKEMVAALPKEDRALFRLTDRQRQVLSSLLGENNSTLRQVNAEQAILQRVLRLAGDFADDLLNRVKADLVASILPQASGDPITRRELESRLQNTLGIGQRRAKTIARTETTNAYNAGRVTSYKESRVVTHVRFLAILDNRTSDICSSRNGLVWEIDDPAVNKNRPPLHPNCRSILSPLMPDINPDHLDIVTDPRRDPSRRAIANLPKGWRS